MQLHEPIQHCSHIFCRQLHELIQHCSHIFHRQLHELIQDHWHIFPDSSKSMSSHSTVATSFMGSSMSPYKTLGTLLHELIQRSSHIFIGSSMSSYSTVATSFICTSTSSYKTFGTFSYAAP